MTSAPPHRIDPDALSRLLPERPQYLKVDAGTASALLHPEASLLQEIIAAVARQQRRSLVVDGSLTDCQWFEGFMRWVQPARCLKRGTRTLILCCRLFAMQTVSPSRLRLRDSLRRQFRFPFSCPAILTKP